jgi:hypothetical protein
MPRLLRHPLGPLVCLALISAATLFPYAVAGAAPSPGVETLLGLAWTLLTATRALAYFLFPFLLSRLTLPATLQTTQVVGGGE